MSHALWRYYFSFISYWHSRSCHDWSTPFTAVGPCGGRPYLGRIGVVKGTFRDARKEATTQAKGQQTKTQGDEEGTATPICENPKSPLSEFERLKENRA